MQHVLQEQLNTYRSQRIAKMEVQEQETIQRAAALSRRNQIESERDNIQNTDDYHQMEDKRTDNDYMSQNHKYTNKFA